MHRILGRSTEDTQAGVTELDEVARRLSGHLGFVHGDRSDATDSHTHADRNGALVAQEADLGIVEIDVHGDDTVGAARQRAQ